jgi:N-acetyl-gamma-glutamyl-phosphate reductase
MPTRDPIRVAVVGATGYSGVELLRYLAGHTGVRVTAVTSEQSAGKALADVHPFFNGKIDLRLAAFEPAAIAAAADVAFTALPHGASAAGVAALIAAGVTVIDLSADFRLPDPAEYTHWYGGTHPAPALLGEAVYGLTEYARAALPGTRLVANPGCYPTGALLGLLPLIDADCVERHGIVIDAKSGVTGAGRTVATEYLFAEVDDNLRAYKIGCHRHAPEIDGHLAVRTGGDHSLTFVPHLLPIRRGLLSTIYTRLRPGVDAAAIAEIFQARYAGERFVTLTGARPPEIREVVGTNDCAIGWAVDAKSGVLVTVTVIDNLGKGAAGQAVQNFNVLHGLPEATALDRFAVVP